MHGAREEACGLAMGEPCDPTHRKRTAASKLQSQGSGLTKRRLSALEILALPTGPRPLSMPRPMALPIEQQHAAMSSTGEGGASIFQMQQGPGVACSKNPEVERHLRLYLLPLNQEVEAAVRKAGLHPFLSLTCRQVQAKSC
jgi:hypothetical protein